MSPSKWDKNQLRNQVDRARTLVAKLEAGLPSDVADRAVLMGEMWARLEMLADAAEPFAGSGHVDG